MEFLKFSYHSVGAFAAFSILCIIAIFLSLKKEKTVATWWLLGMFSGYSALLFGYVFAYSLLTPVGAFHRYFTVIGTLFANACFTAFAYHFPTNDRPKEAKIVIPIALILALGSSLDFVFKTLLMEKSYNFIAHTFNFNYGGGTAIVILFTQLFPFFLLARKTIRYSEYSGRFNKFVESKPNALIEYPKYFFFKYIIGWIKYLNPTGKDAVAAKSFNKALLILLSIAVCNVLNKNGIITYEMYALIFANVTLLACFYVFITYLNNSPEPTSFMVKLVGVSLVSMILVLGYVANITLTISEEDYDNERKAQILGSKTSILERDYEKIPSEIEYILVRPKSADLFDKSFTSEFIRQPNVLTPELITDGIDSYKNFQIQEVLAKVLKMNKRNLSKDKATDEEVEEAVSQFKKTRQYKNIDIENSIELNRLYREAKTLYVHYDFIEKNIKYEIGFSYSEYRKHTHKNASKVLGIIFLAILALLLLFPKIFQSSLVDPLNNLLDGVKKVNDGDLNIVVPVKVQDEIGYLSMSFNSMVSSIKQARKDLQDYADNLEEKVKERTREVQEKMDEVHKLKVQQDGDYFLTSLLAKPLFYNANRSKKSVTEFIIKQKKKFEFRNKTADLGGDICITGNLRFGFGNQNKRFTMILNGDAMGKSMQGAGGSLVMGVVINSIMSRSASNKRILEVSPEQWLTDLYYEVNSVFKSFNGTMVISVTIFLVDDNTGEAFYFNAEHPYSVLYRDGVASFIEEGLTLRKLGSDSEYEFQVHKFQFAVGDKLILASDGRDDIDLTPGESVRTINENEFLFLDIVKEADGSIHKMEEILYSKGTITDDLSILKLEFFGDTVEDETSQMTYSPESETETEEVAIEPLTIEPLVITDEPIVPTLNIASIYQESKSLYQKGEVNKALETLMSAYSVEPNNQKLNKLLGLISFKGKDYTTAVDVLNKYLKIDPDTEEMWYYLSLSQKKLGNYLDSIQSSKKVLELKSTNINNLVNLSDLCRLTGNFAEAREYSEKALMIEPDNQNAKKILEYIGK
jgi:HAMP domain-containing protein